MRLLSIIIFTLNLLLHTSLVFGQEDTAITRDNNWQLFPAFYGDKSWRAVAALDARRSFFRGVPVKINGFRLGAEYKGVHRFGIGFYALARNVVFSDIPVQHPGATDTSLVVFNANYLSLFYDRVIYRNKRWEFALPLEISTGSISGYYEDSTGQFLPIRTELFNALSVGAQTKYFILSWLAPRIAIGYRFVFNTSPEIKSGFNKPYYSFGLHISVGELYRWVKKNNIFNLD